MAVLIDGNFFYAVSNHYKFAHAAASRIGFQGLINYLRKRVAEFEQVDPAVCHCIESHWFRGKMSISQVNRRYQHPEDRLQFLESERAVDDAMMYAGIIPHVFPVRMDIEGNIQEKGIDVLLASEAIEMAYLKKLDVLALVASDSDFVPCVRKLISAGTRVMLVGWDLESTAKTIITSKQLISECSYFLPMHELIDKNENDVREIFIS